MRTSTSTYLRNRIGLIFDPSMEIDRLKGMFYNAIDGI